MKKKHYTERKLKDALKKRRELGKCLFCLLFIVTVYVWVLLKVVTIFKKANQKIKYFGYVYINLFLVEKQNWTEKVLLLILIFVPNLF